MGVLNGVRQAAGNAARNAQRAVDNAQRNVGNVVNNAQRTVNNVVDNTRRNVGNAVNNAQRTVNNTVDNVQRNVGNTVNNVQRNVNNAVDTAQRTVGRNLPAAVNNTVDSFQRTANNAVDNTQRNVGNTVNNVQRNVNNTVDNVQRNVGNAVSNTQRNVNNAVDTAQRNVGNAVDNAQRTAQNTLRTTFNATDNALTSGLQTAREARANVLSTVNQGVRQVNEGYNNLITGAYSGAKQLQQSDNPALRAVGNTHVAVSDAVSNVNRTVDNAVTFWQNKGGAVGAAGEGLARLGQLATTPLRLVDQNVINSRQRPTESRPEPSQLASSAEGQRGASPNQTGQINGAAELAQFVYAGYNGGTNGPVSIVPATVRQGDTTTPVHLVGISGTEAVRGQSTGWITNLKSGFEQNNPGLRNARDAILRTVPEGSNLVLTGHSQGGMIAQQLAADPEIQRRYNVINTVTFGSPLIAPGQREGEVRRIAAAGDPVPRLSGASVNPRTALWAAAGQQNISTNHPINPLDPRTYGKGIDAHMKDYTDESNPELSRMDALGRVNPQVPATIEFNPADRVFFTSPTHTAAPL